jgi:Domain of unknown function (DUF4157)
MNIYASEQSTAANAQAAPVKAMRRRDAIFASEPELTQKDHGKPLPPAVRARTQAKLGHDFSGVRVHTGSAANQAARRIGAVAFATGEDIVLGAGAERPGSPGGDLLLTHELTHVAQQREASHVIDGVSAPGDATERAAHAVAAGGSAIAAGGTVASVQRQATLGREKQVVARDDVQAALTDYLTKVMQEQGGQTLHSTDQVEQAVLMLFKGNPMGGANVQAWLHGVGLPSQPAQFAAQVVHFLPATIPAENLSALHAPVKQAPDKRPKTAGEAAGAVVADSAVTSIVRGLKLPKDQQDKIIEAARKAVAAGLVAIVDQAIGGLGAGPQGAIHNAVDALISQQPGKPGDRQQDGAGSPYHNAMPPSAAPAPPAAPGQHIFRLPPIKWELPGVKPPPKPSPPPAAADPRADAAVAGVDPQALIPAEVRGTDRATGFADAADFARDVAGKLEAAQKAKKYSLYLELGAEYASVKDRGTIYEAAKQIILRMRDARPDKASEVTEVWLMISGRQVFRVLLHPSEP